MGFEEEKNKVGKNIVQGDVYQLIARLTFFCCNILEKNSTFGQRKGEKTNENQKDFKAEERNHPLGKFHSHHNVTLAVYVGEYRIVYMQFVQNIQFVLHHLPVSSNNEISNQQQKKGIAINYTE